MAVIFRLNPYSNGMTCNLNYEKGDFFVFFVLILILME